MTPLALVRLLQLGSQALPIGGYSHSQGLESAIERGAVTDESTTLQWIVAVLEHSLLSYEIPMLLAMTRGWQAAAGAQSQGVESPNAPSRDTEQALRDLNEEFLATRESAELRAASTQMGYSLRALLAVIPDFSAPMLEILRRLDEPSLPCAWSAAAENWRLEPLESAMAYAWSWAENQALVALKTLPLGQSAGQRILARIGSVLAGAWQDLRIDAVPRSNFTPALAILCSQHETQYSRLFRS